MLRRPTRASWHEDGRPSPLADLLAPPKPLPPPRPAEGFVGASHNLPSMIGFGKMQQNPVEGSQFTGARVANPQSGLVHSPQMPSFSDANTGARGGIAAGLAALGMLAGTPHGGAATPSLPPGPGTSTSTGAQTHEMPPNMQPLGTGLTYSTDAQNFAREHPDTGVIAAPQQEMIHGPGPVQPTLATLLTAFGQKPNPSAGLRGRFLS